MDFLPAVKRLMEDRKSMLTVLARVATQRGAPIRPSSQLDRPHAWVDRHVTSRHADVGAGLLVARRAKRGAAPGLELWPTGGRQKREGFSMSPMSPMSLKRLSPWAIHTGFGSEVVQFVDNTGPSPPRPGTSTSLILRRPFRARRDEQFWAVFETAAACDNGYLGWPEGAAQLASLRFVRCRLFEDAAPADEVARGAEILAVLGPEDLLALPPADEAILSWLYKPQVVTHGRLCYVNSNIESDVVNWLLLWTGNDRTHLLAHGLSEFQAAGFVFGNRPLTPEEVRLIVPALLR